MATYVLFLYLKHYRDHIKAVLGKKHYREHYVHTHSHACRHEALRKALSTYSMRFYPEYTVLQMCPHAVYISLTLLAL